MKTREQIYGQEATGLLRIISMYPGLSEEMLCQFYPAKKEKIPAVLSGLQKQGRICISNREGSRSRGEYFLGRKAESSSDNGLIRSVWVLLDFIEKAEFYSAGEFPVKVIFFVDGEMYEVVYAAKGQEPLILHLLNQTKEGSGKRIVLLDEPEQAVLFGAAGVSGFCTVSPEGKVQYYKIR